MKTKLLVLAATTTLICLAASSPGAAQTEANPVFIYATYFRCSNAKVETADDSILKFYKGALDDMVRQKTVSSWGWLVRNTGGEWSRAGYATGASIKELLAALQQLEVRSDHIPKKVAFDEACNSSEDYIWHELAGNDARGHRGVASFSTYYVCDQSREEQADALVKRVLAPMYDKLVADGKLTTWMWAEHVIGGKYRRLATMTAPNMDALLAAREELAKATEHDALTDVVSSICGSHQDYLWEVRQQGP